MGLYDEMEVAASKAHEPHPAAPSAAIAELLHTDDRLDQKIQRLAQDFSIEVLPRTAGKVKHFANLLPERTRVFIPFLPGARFQDCLPLAMRLRRENMEPVPHIAARRLASRAELAETLARLREEAGVTQCLVIAGDPDRAAGPFADSMALLETGLLERNGIRTIFVGGQPEGVSGVPLERIEAALIWKNDYARSTNASLRLITQFTLNIGALTAWRQRLNELGNQLSIHIGIAGPTSLTTLLKFAALTGASASLRAMRRYGAKLTQLASEAAPDALITHLAAQLPSRGSEIIGIGQEIAGLHVYTFGGFTQAAEWMLALKRGDFVLKPRSKGFFVCPARRETG
jgi:methylenetetrahydrofolate reductase (NADPH)